jgi:hypothetical protein
MVRGSWAERVPSCSIVSREWSSSEQPRTQFEFAKHDEVCPILIRSHERLKNKTLLNHPNPPA